MTRRSANPLNRFKTMAYLENLLLTREAEDRALYEVVALNESGRLTDGGRTNLFLVTGDEILTPPVVIDAPDECDAGEWSGGIAIGTDGRLIGGPPVDRGYLYLRRGTEAAVRIRRILTENPPNEKARFVEMTLSDKGFQVSRS